MDILQEKRKLTDRMFKNKLWKLIIMINHLQSLLNIIIIQIYK